MKRNHRISNIEYPTTNPAFDRSLRLFKAGALILVSGIVLASAWPAFGSEPPAHASLASTNRWESLFDGKTMRGWQETDFAGHGITRVEGGNLILETGVTLTGVNYTNPTPRLNYEIELQAMKKDGDDFFCGLTFPVGTTNLTLIVGGWGGGVVGISSLDGMDASENETTRYLEFKKNQWYTIRLRVTAEKLQAWIDGEKMIDAAIEGRRLTMRPGEIELSGPLGLATYETTAALRHIRLRAIPPPSPAEKKKKR